MSAYQDRVQAVARLREIENQVHNLLREVHVLIRFVDPAMGDRLRARWAALILVK